jgi:hypothetical protein
MERTSNAASWRAKVGAIMFAIPNALSAGGWTTSGEYAMENIVT